MLALDPLRPFFVTSRKKIVQKENSVFSFARSFNPSISWIFQHHVINCIYKIFHLSSLYVILKNLRPFHCRHCRFHICMCELPVHLSKLSEIFSGPIAFWLKIVDFRSLLFRTEVCFICIKNKINFTSFTKKFKIARWKKKRKTYNIILFVL